MANSYNYPTIPKFFSKGDQIIFPNSYDIMKFSYTKMIRQIKIELYGNIAYYGCATKGGYVYGSLDWHVYPKDLYIFNPPSSYQGGRNGVRMTPDGPMIVACARTSNDVRTNPYDLYSRFIASGGGGGDPRLQHGEGANAWGGGWIGGTDGECTPGTQSSGGTGNNAIGYFGYAGDDDGWARYDNSGGGWYGGGESGWNGNNDFAAGGSSYASGDPNCNGTQTNSGILLTDTGTIANYSSDGCKCIFTVLKPGWEENDKYKMYVRKLDGQVIPITLFLITSDTVFPDDGSINPFYIKDPDGRQCFAVGYNQKDTDYGYLSFIENGKSYYVTKGG